MNIDWAAANRFLLLAAVALLVLWVARGLLIGGKLGGIDIVIALAFATIVGGSVLLRKRK